MRNLVRIGLLAISLSTANASLALSAIPGNTNESAAVAEPTRSDAHQKDGEWIARHISVKFDPLPAGWIAERNVMDDIWTPLGLKGVNFYAYGGKADGTSFSARSNPDSPLYQAWFGVYVIHGDAGNIETATRLADLDQASWLAAMGDAHPLGLAQIHDWRRGTILIDGEARPLFEFSGKSHSDLGPSSTSLSQHLGMTPASLWLGRLAPFHDLELRGYFAFWRDASRDITVIVYTAAPIFALPAAGKNRDDFRPLKPTFLAMMRKVRIGDIANAHADKR